MKLAPFAPAVLHHRLPHTPLPVADDDYFPAAPDRQYGRAVHHRYKLGSAIFYPLSSIINFFTLADEPCHKPPSVGPNSHGCNVASSTGWHGRGVPESSATLHPCEFGPTD